MKFPQKTSRRLGLLALLGVAAYGPIGYPLWLAHKTRNLDDPVPPEPTEWPGISVVVPAYRERTVIAAKVANTLENGYPGPIEVIVVAGDEETAEAARQTPARVVGGTTRRGKAAAMNTGVSEARMPIVIFTDANAMVDEGGFADLVRWFEDPATGAVVGEKRVGTNGGESLYWAFESWLKRRENRTGTTIGATGELTAVRRADYVDLPSNLAVDDLWLALDVVERGSNIVYEPRVRVSEEESSSPAAEWERRTRIVAGANDVFWRRRRLLVPGRTSVAMQLWGHRVVRQTFGPLAHAGLVVSALGCARKSRLARRFLALHAFGACSLACQQHGRSCGRAGKLAAQVLFLQAVGIGGTIRWARGDRPALWPKPERVVPNGDAARATSPNSSPTAVG